MSTANLEGTAARTRRGPQNHRSLGNVSTNYCTHTPCWIVPALFL